MNNKLKVLLIGTAMAFSIGALSVGCSKKQDTAQSDAAKAPSVDDAAKAASQMTSGATEHKSATHAVSTDVLANLMPTLNGYTAAEPEKTSMNMQGVEYSTASREYKNGDKTIKVTYFDYNYITGLTAAYNMLLNFNMENGDEIQKSEHFGNYPGWINWKKKANDGQVGIVVGDRIFVVIEARNGVSLDDLRSIAGQINLDGIAKAANS